MTPERERRTRFAESVHRSNFNGRHSDGPFQACHVSSCIARCRSLALLERDEQWSADADNFIEGFRSRKQENSMGTAVTVKMDPKTGPARKNFADFKVGEFLLSELMGVLGIKLDDKSIRWFPPSDHTYGSLCNTVRPGKTYLVPAAVELAVTR